MMEFSRDPSTNQGASQEKENRQGDPSKGRSLTESSRQLSADIFKILNEVSRITHRLDPSVPAEWMIKRVQFLAYELQTFIRTVTSTEALRDAEKLSLLNRFFFSEKKFRCVVETSSTQANAPQNGQTIEGLRLNKVLSSRVGAPVVLELIYAYLADVIGLTLEFVDLKPICFLKWRDRDQARYIDVSRNGKTLTNDEVIETLSTRFRMTSFSSSQVLETCSATSFTFEYVSSLKQALGAMHDPQTVLFLQDTLIGYQPSNLQLVGERALLHRRLGNLKSALADLKRYFSFHDKTRSPSELINLHSELIQLLEQL
jgi:regulator of sirC expression with transglutaminase-like and TPR domain